MPGVGPRISTVARSWIHEHVAGGERLERDNVVNPPGIGGPGAVPQSLSDQSVMMRRS